MTRGFALGLAVCSTGCLIVGEPADDTSEDILPLGDVHACLVDITDVGRDLWDVCFARDEHVAMFTREMMLGCEANGQTCAVNCSYASLRPCILACPGTGLQQGCNASHGCYCPPD